MTSGPDFVATDFGFYDCHRYLHCSQCVSSPFPCDWCVDGHRCTHDTAENCRNDILVTGLKVRGAYDLVGCFDIMLSRVVFPVLCTVGGFV